MPGKADAGGNRIEETSQQRSCEDQRGATQGMAEILGGDGGRVTKDQTQKIVIPFLIILIFLASVLVILVPYCCLFCVPLNDMLNVSIGTFS